MRRVLVCVAVIINLSGCGLIAQQQGRESLQEARVSAANCIREVKDSPEGQIVYARLWVGDGTDTADKLSDPKPLTKDQDNAYVKVHYKMRACAQILVAHDNRYAAWEAPYWQELFQRSDAIFNKLASGEIPVGVANKLIIENVGKFQSDVSRGHADAVRVEEAQRQRAAEAMLQAGTQLLASQQRQVTTTNCSWMGNNLNCTSVR